MRCEICGRSEGRIIESRKFNKTLCNKHYSQYGKYGKFLDSYPRNNRDRNEIVEHEQYAEIILYNRKCEEIARTIIDKEDINKISKYKWCLSSGYVRSYSENKSCLLMHRLILNYEKDKQVDHIDTNKLNNRKENLRICTNQENSFNRKNYRNNTSGLRGVGWDKLRNKWFTRISLNGKYIFLGSYENFDDAVKARLEAEEKYFGDFAYKNKNI